MAVLAAFLSRFGELVARQKRILTFRATPEDYQSLGWWDLVWGVSHFWLLTSIVSWSQNEERVPVMLAPFMLLDGSAQGLLYVFGVALLRPSRGSIWKVIPLINLLWVLGVFLHLPDLWEQVLTAFPKGSFPLVPEDFFPPPPSHWLDPQPLYYAQTMSWLGVLAWHSAILMTFFSQGLGLRWAPALLLAILPELLMQVLRDKSPGFWLFASIPPFLAYLIQVGRAWWPIRPVQLEPVVLRGEG